MKVRERQGDMRSSSHEEPQSQKAKPNKRNHTHMTLLCSRTHILVLGFELRAIDFFLTEGADMEVDMTVAALSDKPPYF